MDFMGQEVASVDSMGQEAASRGFHGAGGRLSWIPWDGMTLIVDSMGRKVNARGFHGRKVASRRFHETEGRLS